MRTRAAVLWEAGKDWSVEEIELDPPKAQEVRVRIGASGMCHSDEHVLTGDLPFPLPMIGGHEGAGVVEEVGAGVETLKPGDHVIFGFIPACGRCDDCARGRSNLCVHGAQVAVGRQLSDGTSRHHASGVDLGLMCLLGTFSEQTVVHESSCVKVSPDIPFDRACLLGCGVVTGWGSAVYAGQVKPGDFTVVVGVGGIGANAIQGAKHAGAAHIVAVDPVPWKREQATKFGATHVAESMEAALPLVTELSWGALASQVICTMGLGHGDLMAQALALTGKRGRVVVTNLHGATETQISASMLDLALLEKQIVGSLFGSANIRYDIPRLIRHYWDGQLNLDDLITRTYPLEGINQGYQDMRDGRNIRGVLTMS